MDEAKAKLHGDLIAAYDADVERRNAMDIPTWRIETIEPWLETVEDGAHIIELGAGTGQMAGYVAGLGYRLTAIDLSPGNVAAMIDRGVNARVADFAELPFPDATFNAGFAFNALLHVPRQDLPGVYTEIRRILEPGAPLLVVVWGGEDSSGAYDDDWLDPPRFFNFFSDEAMWAQPTPGFEKLDLTIIEEAVSKELSARAFTLRAT